MYIPILQIQILRHKEIWTWVVCLLSSWHWFSNFRVLKKKITTDLLKMRTSRIRNQILLQMGCKLQWIALRSVNYKLSIFQQCGKRQCSSETDFLWLLNSILAWSSLAGRLHPFGKRFLVVCQWLGRLFFLSHMENRELTSKLPFLQ